MHMSYFKSISYFLIFVALLVSLLGSAVFVTPAYASGITVNSNADITADDGTCTLREAIANANSDSQLYVTVGECAAGSGTDSISFDTSLSGTTIYLVSTLAISSNMTIDGSALASQIKISGDTDNDTDGDVRVFTVSLGATVTLNSLTIKKGSATTGAGIFNDLGSALTIMNSTLTDNATTSGPGGGIRNDGVLSITNSTFSNNTASGGSGGGIRNTGTLTVTNSTFLGNTTTGSGGGIYNVAGFLAITITNSTFSANTAASQGGGIYYEGGTLNYVNTIIANSASGGDCAGSGSIGTNINNLVEDASCSASLNGDPNLGSLADNGGPTETLALQTGSSAINAGDNATCAAAPVSNVDQRGITRPQGGQCDIGSYEYQATVTSNADSGAGTLRQAIADAAAGDTIIFDPLLSGGTIYLASTLTIAQNMTIDGSALASKITLSGDSDQNGTGDVRVLFVHSGMTVTLDSLIITKGNGTALSGEGLTGGGGIQNNTGNNSGAALTVINSIISDSVADNGGGIYNSNGSTLTVTNSTISNNSATSNGGGVYSDGFLLEITNSTLSDNSVTGDGGGVRNGSGMTLTNSTIFGNSATGSGGGIFNDGALTARNSTISGNSASSGGGILNNNALNYANTIIANSTSGGDCVGDVITNTNNLVEDGTCSGNATNFVTGDPGLDTLTDNGGPTLTLALVIGSSAIDAGDNTTCTSSPVNGLDQRGVARPVGAQCDIGAYEGAKDVTAPTVLSSVRFTASPTNAITVYFTVTFSESVTGVDMSDFTLTKSGAVTGALITSVDGSGTTRNVIVSTGLGDGTIRLDVLDDDTIIDAGGNKLGGAFTSGQSYTMDKTAPTITVHNPTTSPATSKTITASVSDGTLTMKNTTGSTCNGTLTFITYSSQTFTSQSDNGKKVCYSVVDMVGNTAYSLSNAIAGIDTVAPTVSSITRVTTSPSAKVSLQFFVTFSESVTGIAAADFSLTKTGITGGSITSITGSGTTRTVTVNSGSGNGSIRLNIPNTATITDLAGNATSGLPYTSGQVYTINKTLTYASAGFLDGWLLESTETSNTGGSLNSTATTFALGDAAADKQYRSILSFNTASLPDNATLTSITLKIKRPTIGFLTGNSNPFSWGQGLKVDVCKLFFGTTNTLQLSDFNFNNASNCLVPAATFGSTPSGAWYSASVSNVAFAKVNKAGLTQFRLRFVKDDNDDGLADYLNFYSGNTTTAADRPQLVINYSVP